MEFEDNHTDSEIESSVKKYVGPSLLILILALVSYYACEKILRIDYDSWKRNR